MRSISPILEVNTLKFAPDGSPAGPKAEFGGDWKLDNSFADGASAKPHGVIYIISSSGGANSTTPSSRARRKPDKLTDKFISQIHSMSVVDVEGKTLRLK